MQGETQCLWGFVRADGQKVRNSNTFPFWPYLCGRNQWTFAVLEVGSGRHESDCIGRLDKRRAPSFVGLLKG